MALGKVIVTNRRALHGKYGAGFDVAGAVQPMIAADAARGLTTQMVDIADAGEMRALGAPTVTDAGDPRQSKDAIDAVWRRLKPNYLLIVGSVDVVPYQDLGNPTPDDGDPGAPGDLPYACEHPYSRRAADFRAPTRVVGRLPDVTGSADPAGLERVLATATHWQLRSPGDYAAYLGVSADVWHQSTALSLRTTFGSDNDLQLAPPSGPAWPDALLGRRSHFFNCHGASLDWRYYGQHGDSYPVAHDAHLIVHRIADGTVAAAECCYGGELYDPRQASGHTSIALTYLLSGAYGFLASSTIAYGPATGNGQADLICQYFLQRVLAGASIGRAALEARQRFVRNTNVLDPSDLKTLAQYVVLGDPSIHPVAQPGKTADQLFAGVASRRANLVANGLALEQARSYAELREGGQPPPAVTALRDRLGLGDVAVSSYDVVPAPVLEQLAAEAPETPDAVHVLTARLPGDAPGPHLRLVVALERAGEIVGVRDAYSR